MPSKIIRILITGSRVMSTHRNAMCMKKGQAVRRERILNCQIAPDCLSDHPVTVFFFWNSRDLDRSSRFGYVVYQMLNHRIDLKPSARQTTNSIQKAEGWRRCFKKHKPSAHFPCRACGCSSLCHFALFAALHWFIGVAHPRPTHRIRLAFAPDRTLCIQPR